MNRLERLCIDVEGEWNWAFEEGWVAAVYYFKEHLGELTDNAVLSGGPEASACHAAYKQWLDSCPHDNTHSDGGNTICSHCHESI